MYVHPLAVARHSSESNVGAGRIPARNKTMSGFKTAQTKTPQGVTGNSPRRSRG